MSDLIDREAFLKQERKYYCEDCDRRKGMKNGKLTLCYEIGEAPCRACWCDDVLTDLEDFPADTRWVRCEEKPKDRQECFVAYKGPLGFIYNSAIFYDDLNSGLGEDIFEDGTSGFVLDCEVGYALTSMDYWMPIEPPMEGEG